MLNLLLLAVTIASFIFAAETKGLTETIVVFCILFSIPTFFLGVVFFVKLSYFKDLLKDLREIKELGKRTYIKNITHIKIVVDGGAQYSAIAKSKIQPSIYSPYRGVNYKSSKEMAELKINKWFEKGKIDLNSGKLVLNIDTVKQIKLVNVDSEPKKMLVKNSSQYKELEEKIINKIKKSKLLGKFYKKETNELIGL